MNNENVATILLNWNSWLYTLSCIESLIEAGIELRHIIVVDNDSSDDSVNRIKDRYQEVNIIPSEFNGGFAHGCNIGISEAIRREYEYVWILNNDTKVNKTTLSALIEKQKSSGLTIVGSVIRDMAYPWGIQAIGGGRISFLTGKVRNITRLEEINEIDYITGASMLITTDFLLAAGLFDEDFFMYWEDAELCMRARRLGYEIGVALDSSVYHEEGASAVKTSYRQTRMISRSTRLFYKKAGNFGVFPAMTQQLGKSVKSTLRGDLGRIYYLWI